MSTTISDNNNLTCCQILFGAKAEAFHNIQMKGGKDKSIFIDQCLEISMKVSSALFQKENTLPLFSGAIAANEACPFYCYRIIKLKQTYHLKSDREKLEMSPDNCFLLLSLFLNSILLSDINKCFKKVFNEQIKALALKPPAPKRYFKAFLQDEGKVRERLAREAYGRLFETYLKEKLLEQNHPLLNELYKLSQEDLLMTYPNFKNVKVYTYPIFGLLIYMAERCEQEQIPVIVKIKVITKQGVEGFLSKKFGNAKERDPAIIFNGIVTDGSFDLSYYRSKGQKCPHNFFQYDDKNRLHNQQETCFFCQPKSATDPSLLKNYQEKFDLVTQDLKKMIYLLAADSLEDVDRLKGYPELLKFYLEMKPEVDKLSFAIATAHTNSIFLEQNRFHLDSPPKEIVHKMFSN